MGVFVLGMHRSGTSAITRVIDLLGVPVGEPRLPPRPDNPAGFWEVEALMQVNDDLLARLGGAWDLPPDPGAGWEHAPALADAREPAVAAFRRAHPGRAWVWKDPRAVLLLPFWRPLTGPGAVAVVVLRNPLDVARSLNRRNRMSTSYALALWERYLRALHRDAAGMPALVVRYDDVLDDPDAAVGALRGFLDRHRQLGDAAPAPAAVLDEVRSFLAPELRHARHTRADLDRDGRVSDAQRAIFDVFDALAGTHDDLRPPPLPPETPWVGVLLAARAAERRGDVLGCDAALARLDEQLGVAEHALAERDAEAVALRASLGAVRDALGRTDIGRVERLALRAARVIRRVQHGGRRAG